MDGEINVLWASPQEVVQGIGRKFYPGETLQLTLGGHFTQNNEYERKHCKIFDWFCETDSVPDPKTVVPATYPAVFVIVADSGAGTLTPDPVPFGGTYTFTIPEGAGDDFGELGQYAFRCVDTRRSDGAPHVADSGRVMSRPFTLTTRKGYDSDPLGQHQAQNRFFFASGGVGAHHFRALVEIGAGGARDDHGGDSVVVRLVHEPEKNGLAWKLEVVGGGHRRPVRLPP
jgi:hypothetical protein